MYVCFVIEMLISFLLHIEQISSHASGDIFNN